MKQTLEKLKSAFPDSFVNYNGEFVAHRRANEYFSIRGLLSADEIVYRSIEYLSRACCKTRPFKTGDANINFRYFMIDGMNAFLVTNFTHVDFLRIYVRLGNGINRRLTEAFVKSGYDMRILERRDGEKMISSDMLLQVLNGLEYQAPTLEQMRGGNAVLRKLIPSVIAKQPAVKVCTLINCHKCEYWRVTFDNSGYGMCLRYGVRKHKSGFCDEADPKAVTPSIEESGEERNEA